MERGGLEEAKVVRYKLICVACLPPRVLVTSRPGLLPRAISGPMVLPQLGSVLASVALADTKGHTDGWNPGQT